ncbi:MAG: hypothetical protein V4577_29955 [Bacteroidota bacterium]
MSHTLKLYSFAFLAAGVWLLQSCDAIIEPSIKNKLIQLEAPADLSQSSNYAINFWWDEVEHALSYRLQVVTQTFAAPGGLVLDTVVTRNRFLFTFNPGKYQWRVMAANGSSGTEYTSPRSFEVEPSSIKQQTVQLSLPGNNFITNQTTVVFQWSSLYGATKYRFEIDSNNFVDESKVLANMPISGLQVSYTFPADRHYQWRVRAENDTAQSLWSAINLVTYDHMPPKAVAVTAPADNLTVSLPVALQWSATEAGAKYKLYVYKSDSTTLYNNSFPVTLNALSYSFNSGVSGDKVYWKVSAVDAAGNEGPASDLRHFVIQ